MIIDIVKESLWQQFAASIDMLRNAIVMWPDDRWESKPRAFRMAFHTLFFIEYYFTNPPEDFRSTLPTFDDGESDIAPTRVHTKNEILEYLEICREKCRKEIFAMNESNFDRRWQLKKWNRDFNYYELMMYNMRHVQHHAAQLNMMLRSEINESPDWISRTSDPGM